MTRHLVWALMATVALSPALSPQRPTFSTATRTVVVQAIVTDRGRPVEGLAAKDFELRDNGVVQIIESVVADDNRGLDVSMLLDHSGSVRSSLGSELANAARQLASLLQEQDTSDVWLFDGSLRRPAGRAPASRAVTPMGDGGTMLFDAISAAAMRQPRQLRPRVIYVFTDGLDTRSLISRRTRLELLARSNAVVILLAFSRLGRTSQWLTHGGTAGDYDYLLREIADATGGLFGDVRAGRDVSDLLRASLASVRKGYTITYSPRGVEPRGWHSITLNSANAAHQIAAKRGYYWDTR